MYIGITTFKERFDTHFKLLLEDIKGFPAIIAVNASYKDGLCKDYCKEMLKLLSYYDNITPIFYQQMRGCAKMWNDLIIHSPSSHILISNDDNRIINCQKLLEDCSNHSKTCDFFKINRCMSHFVAGKEVMIKLSWFDERYLGFGEEDGDIMWRYLKMFGQPIPNYENSNIENHSSNIIDQNIKTYYGKYTEFNRQFCYCENNDYKIPCKYVPDPEGLQSTYGEKMKQQLPDIIQYPYEEFFIKNKNLL